MCIKNAVSKNTTARRIMFIWNRIGDLQHVYLYTCGRAEKDPGKTGMEAMTGTDRR